MSNRERAQQAAVIIKLHVTCVMRYIHADVLYCSIINHPNDKTTQSNDNTVATHAYQCMQTNITRSMLAHVGMCIRYTFIDTCTNIYGSIYDVK